VSIKIIERFVGGSAKIPSAPGQPGAEISLQRYWFLFFIKLQLDRTCA